MLQHLHDQGQEVADKEAGIKGVIILEVLEQVLERLAQETADKEVEIKAVTLGVLGQRLEGLEWLALVGANPNTHLY